VFSGTSSVGLLIYADDEDSYPALLTLLNGFSQNEMLRTKKLVAFQGRRRDCTIKACVTGGAVHRSLVETLRLGGSIDAWEVVASAVRPCHNAGMFPNCVSRSCNGIEVHERPHLRLVSLTVADDASMWLVVMTACYESPTNSHGYTEYCKAYGLPCINCWARLGMRLWTV
jgi:hypothetical protein